MASCVPRRPHTHLFCPDTPSHRDWIIHFCMHAPSCGHRTFSAGARAARRPAAAAPAAAPPRAPTPAPLAGRTRNKRAGYVRLCHQDVSSPLSSMQLVHVQPRGCRIFITTECRWACESHLGNILLVTLGRTGGWHEVLHRQIIVLVGFSRTRARRLGS